MFDNIIAFVSEKVVLFDNIFLILVIYFSLQCFSKGFFLSLISFLKWVLALVVTIILVPRVEPYLSDYINNNFILEIGLGIAVYIIALFILILLGKAIGRLFSYTGMGSVDKVFGFFFGIAKSYVLIVCLFTSLDVIYDSKKWPLNLKDSLTFPWVEKGSIYLIKVFPNQKQYEDAKEKVQDV